jgi:heparosan-N-sulfate-glucuronate 5-epimerase
MGTVVTSRRSSAGFFSSASSFFLPVGSQVDPDGVRGYPIDMRVKADSPTWPRPNLVGPSALYAAVAQYGLGCYERWLAGDGQTWLDAAVQVGEHLCAHQRPDGAWAHAAPFPHTQRLDPPWSSGLAQGEGASLLVRLHLETSDERFAHAARLGIGPLSVPMAGGGVQGELAGYPWPEEYPTTPPAHVLNGAMFALWGFRDVGIGLGDADASQAFATGLDAVVANLHRYDTGHWSLYWLNPKPIRNWASSFYHALHISQLTVMDMLSPRPELAPTRDRWQRYADSALSRRLALAHKAAFRTLVPRNRLLANRLPWNRP